MSFDLENFVWHICSPSKLRNLKVDALESQHWFISTVKCEAGLLFISSLSICCFNALSWHRQPPNRFLDHLMVSGGFFCLFFVLLCSFKPHDCHTPTKNSFTKSGFFQHAKDLEKTNLASTRVQWRYRLPNKNCTSISGAVDTFPWHQPLFLATKWSQEPEPGGKWSIDLIWGSVVQHCGPVTLWQSHYGVNTVTGLHWLEPEYINREMTNVDLQYSLTAISPLERSHWVYFRDFICAHICLCEQHSSSTVCQRTNNCGKPDRGNLQYRWQDGHKTGCG